MQGFWEWLTNFAKSIINSNIIDEIQYAMLMFESAHICKAKRKSKGNFGKWIIGKWTSLGKGDWE